MEKRRVREGRQGDRGGGGDQEGHAGEGHGGGGRRGGVFLGAAEVMSDSEGSLRRRQHHHLANMWIWFNAGLASVAAPPRALFAFLLVSLSGLVPSSARMFSIHADLY